MEQLEYFWNGEIVKDKISWLTIEFPKENASSLLGELIDICLHDLIFREPVPSLDTLSYPLEVQTALKILYNKVIERNNPTEGLTNPDEQWDYAIIEEVKENGRKND